MLAGGKCLSLCYVGRRNGFPSEKVSTMYKQLTPTFKLNKKVSFFAIVMSLGLKMYSTIG